MPILAPRTLQRLEKLRALSEVLLVPATMPVTMLGVACFFLISALLVLAFGRPLKDFGFVLSACVLLVGYFLNQTMTLFTQIRERTLSFLRHNRVDKDFIEADRAASAFFRMNPTISQSDLFLLCFSYEETFVGIRRKIQMIANFYEEMYLSIETGEVQERSLKRFYGTNFIRFYNNLAKLLPTIRNDPPIQGSPIGKQTQSDIYELTDKLATRWRTNDHMS